MTHSKDIRERIEKIMSTVVYTARHSYSLDEEIIVEPTQAIESLLVEARVDELEQAYWQVDIVSLHQYNHYDAQEAIQYRIDRLKAQLTKEEKE